MVSSMPVLFGAFEQYLLGFVLFFFAIVLIILILLQRGRGGGLVGALGGMGGQSAFGAKAGDKVMWTTVGVAICWIFLCAVTALRLRGTGDAFGDEDFTGRGVISADRSGDTTETERPLPVSPAAPGRPGTTGSAAPPPPSPPTSNGGGDSPTP